MDEPPLDDRRAARFLLALLAVLSVASLFIVRPFLTGTIFALVIGLMLQPTMRRLTRIVRFRWIAGGILVLVVLAMAVVPLAMIGVELFQEARALVERSAEGGYDTALVDALVSLGMSEETAAKLFADAVAQAGAIVRATALPTLTAIATLAANLGVFVFLLYFVLVGANDILALLHRALPLAKDRREHLMATVAQRVRVLFLGTFLVALIQGVLAGLGWWMFGFPNPVFWGFVMTILAVIPAIGPIIVMAPAGVIAILQGDTVSGVAIIVWGLAVVGLVDNVTRPYIVGRGTGVHPGLVLLGTLGGLALLGPTGFVLGPLILSMLSPILEEWQSVAKPSEAS